MSMAPKNWDEYFERIDKIRPNFFQYLNPNVTFKYYEIRDEVTPAPVVDHDPLPIIKPMRRFKGD